MDDTFQRESQPWERAGGALHLIGEMGVYLHTSYRLPIPPRNWLIEQHLESTIVPRLLSHLPK